MAPGSEAMLVAIAGLAGSDAAILLACLALAAAIMFFIFGIKPDAADSAPHRSQLDQLLERRDTIYENLRDLRFEHRAGKFSEQDYDRTNQALETEAAGVLAEIEKVTGGPGRLTTRPAATVGRPTNPGKSPS